MNDHALAHHLAEQARDLLVRLRRTDLGGEELGREGDRQAHALLVGALREQRPGDAVLSEEGALERGPRTWIVDPLDGTLEYRVGRDDWAVHVALAENGVLVAGAVALASGRTHSTLTPAPLPVAPQRTRPRVVVSRSHRPPLADALAAVLDADLVPLGSAGVKTVEVPPVAVAEAAGAHASRIDGAPLVYGGPTACIPDLLVCRPELAPVLLEALSAARSS
ncbi:3'(2'),5'-bisphosphate nucleotidase CysQ [Lentzea roselyniae]|uniref:3'(2'),5-bisphosphonucleoside 3'(2')-phosphohydrolase n=1 Tax=Lentzea roselyniae TaxID=531940 RepID=A0ABP7B182_9PSEU